jgi:sodium/potassium/calcium exchanger 6
MAECSYDSIITSDDSCRFVLNNCGGLSTYLNFTKFYYCDLNRNVPIIVTIAIIFGILIFHCLSTITDHYLTSSIEVVAKKLKLSEAIAGITLLAFSASASDVVTAVVAGGREETGVSVVLGGLFGACLFSVTVVLAGCIIGAKKIEIDKRDLTIDIGFLIVALIYFIFLTLFDEVSPLLVSGFFLIYVLFFACYLKFSYRKPLVLSPQQPEERENNVVPQSIEIVMPPTNNEIESKEDDCGTKESSTVLSEEKKVPKTKIFNKVKKLIIAPILFIGNITMPPFEKDQWKLYRAALFPICAPVFIIWQLNLIETFNEHWWLWIILGVFSLLASILIIVKGWKKNLAVAYEGTFAIASMIVSVLWLVLVSTLLVDFLAFIQVISGLSIYFLSITLLAWGNSLADFFINYSIANKGFGKTAMGGVYGSQVFVILVGFGGGLFRMTLEQSVSLHLYDFKGENRRENIVTLILIATIFFTLIFTLIAAKWKKWVLNYKMATFSLAFYVLFTVGITVTTFV